MSIDTSIDATVEATAGAHAPMPAGPAAWMTFSIDGVAYALPLTELREVIRVERITPVPRAPARIRGLTSVRGRLVPVLDAAVALGLAPCAIDDAARILIVFHAGRPLGILVEHVGGIELAAAVDPEVAAAEPALAPPGPRFLDLAPLLEAR